jgi:hypothetical protein
MAELIFRIPSRTVQYGYVEMPLAMEPGMSPEMIASAYVSYVYAFQKEEEATIKRLAEGVSVSDGAATPEKPVTQASSAPEEPSRDDVEAQAQELLDKGLGGVTEVPEYGGVEGDALYNEAKAPWVEPAVDAKPKPWETEGRGAVSPEAPMPDATLNDW